jgi:hypothetical protein
MFHYVMPTSNRNISKKYYTHYWHPKQVCLQHYNMLHHMYQHVSLQRIYLWIQCTNPTDCHITRTFDYNHSLSKPLHLHILNAFLKDSCLLLISTFNSKRTKSQKWAKHVIYEVCFLKKIGNTSGHTLSQGRVSVCCSYGPFQLKSCSVIHGLTAQYDTLSVKWWGTACQYKIAGY